MTSVLCTSNIACYHGNHVFPGNNMYPTQRGYLLISKDAGENPSLLSVACMLKFLYAGDVVCKRNFSCTHTHIASLQDVQFGMSICESHLCLPRVTFVERDCSRNPYQHKCTRADFLLTAIKKCPVTFLRNLQSLTVLHLFPHAAIKHTPLKDSPNWIAG